MSSSNDSIRPGMDIAVIGMSGKFPGSKNINEFWENLKGGIESIYFFSDVELIEAGIKPELVKDPNYIKAKGILEGIEYFDAKFFNYSPKEAKIMDPQIRLLHECVWETLEDAAYNPETYDGLIGLYAGASPNLPWECMSFTSEGDSLDNFTIGMKNNKDLLSTHISYNLNLKGPSITLYTACSTSLVAIHQACQGLLSGDCDIALAGGASIELPDKAGYLYQKGMIKSPDGHCRAFDGKAEGTVYGNGVGVVALKRIEDAIADNDNIYAVIKGTAINNDGKRKVGYTAPSVEGQAEVISTAHQLAEVDVEDISYVETHGTGTSIGDPIEVEGLKMAFKTTKKGFCGLGSVKPNIGHLDAAAGVTSFIKTAMILKNKQIPPHIYFENPNLKIDFIDSPFFVNTKLRELNEHKALIAGVSSFGLGGTNCHVVMQEPPIPRTSTSSKKYELVTLSAKTETALESMSKNLAEYLKKNSNVNIADVAYTLNVGRQKFKYRKAMVCSNVEEIIRNFSNENLRAGNRRNLKDDRREVVLIFSEKENLEDYKNIICELYFTEPKFKKYMDMCFEVINSLLEYNMKNGIFSKNNEDVLIGKISLELKKSLINFIVQYSLGKMIIDFGINPRAMVGCGVGEYVSATISGIISLTDTVKLIRYIDQRIKQDFSQDKSLGISVFNDIRFNNAKIPYISASLEKWITLGDISQPDYWINVASCEVKDTYIANEILRSLNPIYIEVSNGLNLRQLINEEIYISNQKNINMTKTNRGYWQWYVLYMISLLWELGVQIDWKQYYCEEQRARLSLPTYPFERERYWVEGISLESLINKNIDNSSQNKIEEIKKNKINDWFYTPVWKIESIKKSTEISSNWIIFLDEYGIGEEVVKKLKQNKSEVIIVNKGEHYNKVKENKYSINPTDHNDYVRLVSELSTNSKLNYNILHFWSIDDENEECKAFDLGYYSLIYLAKAITKQSIFNRLQLTVVTSNMMKVSEEDKINPAKRTVIAVAKVLPQECSNISCQCVDISINEITNLENDKIINQLIFEIKSMLNGQVVAYRNYNRLVLNYEKLYNDQLQEALKIDLDKPTFVLKEKGVYVITGGTGDIGLTMAEYLTKSVRARLVLISRTGLPDRKEWEKHLENNNESPIGSKIKQIIRLEELGAEVYVFSADVSDEITMNKCIDSVESQFGVVNGVLHAAGIVRVKSGLTPIERISTNECEEQFLPKIQGAIVLEKVLRNRNIDFCIMISSLAPILGGLGHVAYAAANIYMDAFVEKINTEGNNKWISVNWAEWTNPNKTFVKHPIGKNIEKLELTKEEGIKSLQCVLSMLTVNRLVISTGDLQSRINQWVNIKEFEDRDNEIKSKSFMQQEFGYGHQSKLTKVDIEKIISDIWMEFYGVDNVGTEENFFDLGATSLDFIHINSKIGKTLKRHIPLEVMFEYPTIKSLAQYLSPNEELILSGGEKNENFKNQSTTGNVAVIGINGRFPGAKDINEFWDNLINGVESIKFFTDEELKASGISKDTYENKNYVKAKGYLDDLECFDAEFFNYSAKDAELMDPQIRIFHECVWGALEDSGYNPEIYKGSIGLYAGATPNLYWEVMAQMSQNCDSAGQFEASLLYDKDSLTTQVSYKLNLKGPSVTLFTGCSTSLVAIDTAYQALLLGKCDMAIAGGVSVTLPLKSGYMYQSGMILSADGHIRSFDEKASGMVFGDGVAAVVLKKLEDAIKDGDSIYAVIKGSAVNNDGSMKVGYTAPGVRGQVDVIKSAHNMAKVNPETITYVETHGTATKLGDTVEIKALKQAFNTEKTGFCKIGTLKSNLGHMVCASGVGGFIKTVLALKYKKIPPSLNYETPNLEINFNDSPFIVNTKLSDWNIEGNPLRAGVSSFGIGGTNAHVVLEEAPVLKSSLRKRHWKMLMLSAKTEQALEKMTENLVQHLVKNPDINLSDVCYTLQQGRKKFKYRRTLLAEEVEDAIENLKLLDSSKVKTKLIKKEKKSVVFMFSGQGSQYVNMGMELYIMEPIFREEIDRCLNILKDISDLDVKEILYPSEENYQQAAERINETKITQLIIFIFEYALAKYLIKLGITPSSMIGYSFGEYVAAQISGVISLEDVLKVIIIRGNLISSLPKGAMVSVPLTEHELKPIIKEFELKTSDKYKISISIINGTSCIVSGSSEAVDQFETFIKSKKYMCMRVQMSYAIHSPEMNVITDEFEKQIRNIQLNKPQIPYISGVTGTWITNEQATDYKYWIEHLVSTIRFSDGIGELVKEKDSIFVEIGPGRDLCILINKFLEKEPERIVNIVRHKNDSSSDLQFLLTKIAHLWVQGININWNNFYSDEERLRLNLPIYPFESKRFWIDGNPYDMIGNINKDNSINKRMDLEDWFYVPQWNRTSISKDDINMQDSTWVVFVDKAEIAVDIINNLETNVKNIIKVYSGNSFKNVNDNNFIINPIECKDYDKLFDKLNFNGKCIRIVHSWGIDNFDDEDNQYDNFKKSQELGFYSLLYIAKSLSKRDINKKIYIDVITSNMQEITGEEVIYPEKSTIISAVTVIPQEYSNIRCRSIDTNLLGGNYFSKQNIINQLTEELSSNVWDSIVGYRGRYRWIKNYEHIKLKSAEDNVIPLKEGGVYLITGGMGNVGYILAEYITRKVKAKVVLTGRTKLPNREEWSYWLYNHDEKDKISDRIRKILNLEKNGSEVLVYNVDSTNENEMINMVIDIEQRFGSIDGVIHSAGILDGSSFNLINGLNRENCEIQFDSKVYGVWCLEKILRGKHIDFCLLMSSISSVLGGLGYASYAAANIYMESLAQKYNEESDIRWISVAWSEWRSKNEKDEIRKIGESISELSMSPMESIEAFKRILSNNTLNQVVCSPGDLMMRIDQWVKLQSVKEDVISYDENKPLYHDRPQLSSVYVSPQDEEEVVIVNIWENMFRIEGIGIEDDFFELGGDSLKAITAISQIHKKLDIEVPIVEFFNSPNIKGIAQYIKSSNKSKYLSINKVQEKEYYVTSSAQKRIYILYKMAPESTAYNDTSAVVIEGKINIQRFEEACELLIERHESLRTTFEMINGQVVQRIHPKINFNIDYYESYEENAKALAKSIIRPFNLEIAPLFRLYLIKICETQHILVMDFHHVITDGISYGIFISDLLNLYVGNDLPKLDVQYKDFAEWQNNDRESETFKKQESFWLNMYKDNVPLLNMPTDFNRQKVQRFDGDSFSFNIDRELTSKIKTFGKERGLTLFTVLFSTSYILLSKYTGQEDIIIGTPITGRVHADLQNIIGVFVNMLAIRNFPKQDKKLSEFLEEVKLCSYECFENQSYQFDDLVLKLGLQGNMSRNPMFDFVFLLQNMAPEDVSTEGLNIIPYDFGHKRSQFDMLFRAEENEELISMIVEYSTALFRNETIKRFCQRYVEVLEQVISSTDETKLKEIIISDDFIKPKQNLIIDNSDEFDF